MPACSWVRYLFLGTWRVLPAAVAVAVLAAVAPRTVLADASVSRVQPCAFGALGITDPNKGGSIAARMIQQQRFEPLYQAAVDCLPPTQRGTLTPALKREEQLAGSGPDAYTQFVDHVVWAITGRQAQDAWLAPPGPDATNLPTPTETYPFHAYALNIDPGSMAQYFWLAPAAVVASSLFVFLAALATLFVRLTMWTMTMDVSQPAGGVITRGVEALQHGLYLPLLPVVVGMVAIWMLWSWRTGRMSSIWSAAGWSAAMVAVASIYAAIPSQIAQGADQYSAALAQIALGTAARVDPGVGSGDLAVTGPPQDAALRVYLDRWWQEDVYLPWTLAEFGMVDPASPDGKRALGTEVLADIQLTGGVADFAADGTCKVAGIVPDPIGCDQYKNDDLQSQSQSLKDWFDGVNPTRLGYEILAMIGFLPGAALLLIVAGAVAVSELVFLLCVLAAPVVFLVAVHPTAGRAFLSRWLDVALGALATRVTYSLLLGLLMIVDGVLAASFTKSGWGVVMLLQAAAAFALLYLRRRLFRSLSGALQTGGITAPLEHGEDHAWARRRWPEQAWSKRGDWREFFTGVATGAGFSWAWNRGQNNKTRDKRTSGPSPDVTLARFGGAGGDEVEDSVWEEILQGRLPKVIYNPPHLPPGSAGQGGPGGKKPPPILPGGVGGLVTTAIAAANPTAAAVVSGTVAAASLATAPARAAEAGAKAVAGSYVDAVREDVGSGIGPSRASVPTPTPSVAPPGDVIDLTQGEDGKWYPWRAAPDGEEGRR